MNTIGQNVRRLRSRRAWSMRDLARESGVGLDAICRTENGQSAPQPKTVRRLAKALGVDPGELMEGRNDALD